MTRCINFSAGPATLPEEILSQAQSELLNWQGRGYSILEVSHRSPEFGELLDKTIQDTRSLLAVPDNYDILFLVAPARAHFAAVPLNLMGSATTAAYVVTGLWSKLAIEESKRYLTPACVFDIHTKDAHTVGDPGAWAIPEDAAYCYTTDNETVHGIQLLVLPNTDVPIVSDMTSSLFMRPINVADYGMIFAGVQKNISTSGLSMVIIQKDLLDRAHPMTPSVLNYHDQAKANSLLNTNNNFSVYLASLMFDWINAQGGLEEMQQRSMQKSQKLYQFIDETDFYVNAVDPNCRSQINVTFRLSDRSRESEFIEAARARGIIGIAGHKLAGGLRVSLYNAVSLAMVDSLLEFMADFQRT